MPNVASTTKREHCWRPSPLTPWCERWRSIRPRSTTDGRCDLMTLTSGRGPLSGNPAGRFSAPLPEGIVYIEPFPRRVRGTVGDKTVVDSEGVLLVHRAGHPPAYAFPSDDVHGLATEPEPEAPGYVTVPWDA